VFWPNGTVLRYCVRIQDFDLLWASLIATSACLSFWVADLSLLSAFAKPE
jgi:hypothetical protein